MSSMAAPKADGILAGMTRGIHNGRKEVLWEDQSYGVHLEFWPVL